jgi:hypothetical protein
VIPGLLLFARYAYAPNRLGYCGPADHEALFGYLAENRVDEGLTRLSEQFAGAYPYLRLIAEANGIGDPFDRGVVEAYWVGNRMLERVGAASLFSSLRERFRPRMDARAFSWLTGSLGDGTRPHHNFHVFDVYRRAGLLRDSRAKVAVERMDACRVSWGRVVAADGAEVVVQRAPLVLSGGKLALDAPVPVRVLRRADGRGYLDEFRPGEAVSIHWNWVCDRLDPHALRELVRVTRRAIAHANLTM